MRIITAHRPSSSNKTASVSSKQNEAAITPFDLVHSFHTLVYLLHEQLPLRVRKTSQSHAQTTRHGMKVHQETEASHMSSNPTSSSQVFGSKRIIEFPTSDLIFLGCFAVVLSFASPRFCEKLLKWPAWLKHIRTSAILDK